METHILLAQLKGLLARAPSFADYEPTSAEHQDWLGQAHARVQRWNAGEASSFRLAANSLVGQLMRDHSLATVFGILNRAVADLELQVPASPAQAFGPGAVYDFFKALNTVISSTQSSLLIVDPYMDDTIFDTYLSAVPKTVAIRLLVEGYSAKVKPAAQRFASQHGNPIEARRSPEFHDRVIFVDTSECWVLGMSIRKAAESKPTYLAPLSPDIAALKLSHYERVWSNATAI